MVEKVEYAAGSNKSLRFDVLLRKLCTILFLSKLQTFLSPFKPKAIDYCILKIQIFSAF